MSSSASNRGSSKSGIRSMSRDGSINKNSAAKEPSKTLPKAGEVTVSDFMKGETGEEQEVQEVIRDATTSETSLRHLFYLEYKKNFPEGQKNPIVYSRFGKAHYRSNEKFDVNNFNQLVRTCNLKKFFKSQESNALIKGNNRKFSEPVSFPSGDYYKPQGPQDRTLVFESRFESGNLQLAHKQSDTEYDLILQNDINSKGHTQWFYFRVSNVKKGMKVKFNMLNMIKSKSLYNEGMKVLIYSEKRQDWVKEKRESDSASKKERALQQGWTRGGEEMSYF